MVPYVRHGIAYQRSIDDYIRDTLKVGQEEEILPMWNHMLKYALHVRRKPIFFDADFLDNPTPQTLNCRAGAFAALKAAGLDVSSIMTMEAAGIACERMPLGPVFSNAASTAKLSIEELRAETESLIASLHPPSRPPPDHVYELGFEWGN